MKQTETYLNGSTLLFPAAEIDVMRRACDIAMAGIRATVSFIQPGVDERSLEGILEAEFKKGERSGSGELPRTAEGMANLRDLRHQRA
jgi:hypothetical protein